MTRTSSTWKLMNGPARVLFMAFQRPVAIPGVKMADFPPPCHDQRSKSGPERGRRPDSDA